MTGFARPAAIPAQADGWELRDVNGQTIARFDFLADAFRQQVIDANAGKPTTTLWHEVRGRWHPHPSPRTS